MLKRTFRRGGVHPPEAKDLCRNKPIETLPLPKIVTIPLVQSIGAPARAIVKPRDEVKVGQLIAEAGGFVSAPIHASISGTVKKVGPFPTSIGPHVECIQIESDGADTWVDEVSLTAADFDLEDPEKGRPEALFEAVAEAGVVGMGGAAFPTAVKLRPPKGVTIDTLLLNGAECEPYLTADHRLMLEHAPEVVLGMRVLMKILGVSRGVIGIEDNKPDAIETMQAAVDGIPGVSVEICRTAYPQGAEKQLIEATLGREVPSGKLPMHVGAVVQNVGTAFAAFEAVVRRKPLVERVLTVSGRAIVAPKNLRVRVGTSIADVAAHCGGVTDGLTKLIMGGPMMGKALKSIDIPVLKATSGLLFLDAEEGRDARELACVRCGRCVAACPQGLVPCDLGAMAEFGKYADMVDGADCVECGSCQYICPAHRRLVHFIRLGKSEYRRVQSAPKK